VVAPGFAEFGVGVNGTSAGGYTPTGTGITYAVSQIPASGLEITIGVVEADGGVSYPYVSIGSGGDRSGTVPWTSFGVTGTPALVAVEFGPGFGVSGSYNFCVTNLTL